MDFIGTRLCKISPVTQIAVMEYRLSRRRSSDARHEPSVYNHMASEVEIHDRY